MSTFDPSAYRITIQRKITDGSACFVGTVSELPDVEVFEKTYKRAYEALTEVIQDLKAAADEQVRDFPVPFNSSTESSSRITLRLPRSLHTKVSKFAEIEGVSLNTCLLYLIADGVSAKIAQVQSPTTVSVDSLKRAFEMHANTAINTVTGSFSKIEKGRKQVFLSYLTKDNLAATASSTVVSPHLGWQTVVRQRAKVDA